jgi:hypothetical protein
MVERCYEDTPFFNEAEADVLKLMRGKINGRLEIYFHDGRVNRIKNFSELHTLDLEGISQQIDEKAYGTYTVKKQNGRIVYILDEGNVKYDTKTGRRVTE